MSLSTPEETLDPQDWESLRALGHQMIDDMLDYLASVRDRPAWQPVSPAVKRDLNQPLPHDPQGAAAAYADFKRDVLAHPMGNLHPRFWAWVISPGTPLGMLSEMLAAGVNPNVGGAAHAAPEVEAQVIDWCKEMLVYPEDGSGILVSGGSMANLVGLTVARNTHSGIDLRKAGVQALPARAILYCSTETHSSVQKAVELLGFGSDSIHYIDVNDAYQINLDALEAAIHADRAAGYSPWCIVGNAGTTNTASFDDLNRLAGIAAREHVWYHVDGAFGALAALAPDLRPLTSGMERADSLAFDLHKWFYAPHEVGCALIRNPKLHHRAFTLTPSYLAHGERGITAGELWYSDYGFQLSRGFRALKIWMMIKAEGIDKYGRLIQQNVDQARYLEQLIADAPELELLAPVALNIVCFRFVTAGMDTNELNTLNTELMIRVQESGNLVVTGTVLHGKQAIRMCNVNHRSRREDFDLLVREVISTGKEITAQSVSN